MRKINYAKQHLNLNTIQTIYIWLLSRRSRLLTFTYQTKYKNEFEKIRKDEKVVLIFKTILICFKRDKEECNISFLSPKLRTNRHND